MGELGSLLVRAREAQGLTLEDAERDTRISRRYLAALETEDFEVIPAPVYARGFLRSYSQYLGLDAQETLGLFPGDSNGDGSAARARRPTMREPISAVGASRPSWSREQKAPEARPPSARPPGRERQQSPRPTTTNEPTIGVDIGLATDTRPGSGRGGGLEAGTRPTRRQRELAPPPTRRIRTDPGANTRTATVTLVAVVAMVAMVGLAFLISRLGDDATTQAPGATDSTPVPRKATPTPTVPGGGEPAAVPDVQGLGVVRAREVLKQAGFAVNEKDELNAQPKGTVLDQSPGPDVEHPLGEAVTIVVSSGPGTPAP